MNLKIDSRKVKPGDTFVAIKGNNVDGHNYIDDAIKNGATLVVAEHGNYKVKTIIVNDTKKYLTDYISNNYKDEIKDLKIIGVTGTNGKTTTSYLTYQILNELGVKTSYIGTIGFYINNTYKELDNTTPNIVDLYELLLESKKEKCQYVIMEVSSHALDFERVKGIEFTEIAFTNLTQDHLDYHLTMNNYLKAKLKIFNYLKKDGIAIVNIDDQYGEYFKQGYYKTLGKKESNYQILSYQNIAKGTKIILKNDQEYEIITNLKNEFNVYNYITSLALVNSLGYTISDIIKVTKNIYPPKGRCELIHYKDNIIVIDYAHTPDATEKIISSFNKEKQGKLITIIGCGGDRDPKKRPIMGQIATDLSDYVIFTNDNPRTEDETKIMNDIVKNLKKDNYEIIYDRKKAIHKGLEILTDNDYLLILGKGHEDYQIIGTTKIHFSDSEVVNEYLNL